jgi:F-type H+-transporting ATPase subunit a
VNEDVNVPFIQGAADTAHGAADTLRAGAEALGAAAGHGGEKGPVDFTELLHHVQDARVLDTPFGRVDLPQFPPLHLAGMSIDMSITKHVVFLWIAALLLCIVAVAVARKNARRAVPTGFGNLFEMIVVFLRDEVAIPNMGSGGLKYMPYLLTTFFFILVMNLLGLIPWGASATGNINVTAGLAIIAFVMIQASAIRAQGFGHYLAHLTGGVHWALWPIMIPIEILGLFTKPFALCMRLFANMLGGHIVIVSLLGLIFVFGSYFVALGPVAFVVGINFLELFVAFLQAYIFVMLTSLFMGLGIQAGESSHGAHGHEGSVGHSS